MVSGVSNYYIVNVDAGNLNQSGIQSTSLNNSLNLNDNNTAAVFNSLTYRSTFQRGNFLLKGDVAAFVCDGTSDHSYIDRESRIEQIVLAFDVYQLNDVFLCDVIYFTAAISGVDECTKTNFCECTGLMCCNISEQVAKCALRYVVSFKFVFQRHFCQRRNSCPVTRDVSFQHTFVCIVLCATAVLVALRTAVYICKVFRLACFQKSFFHSFVQSFGNRTCNETAGGQRIAVLNQLCSFICGDNFNTSHRQSPPKISFWVMVRHWGSRPPQCRNRFHQAMR